MARGDIDLQLLSTIQSKKDKLSYCMKGYIQYIIDNQDKIIQFQYILMQQSPEFFHVLSFDLLYFMNMRKKKELLQKKE